MIKFTTIYIVEITQNIGIFILYKKINCSKFYDNLSLSHC